MALTSTRRAICIFERKRRQRAPFRIQFPAKYLTFVLGFMEFITEDELQEHSGGTRVATHRICEP